MKYDGAEIELSEATKEHITQKLNDIRDMLLFTQNWQDYTLDLLEARVIEASMACHAIRSELAYNVSVQRMPERKPQAAAKQPATIDDIFGNLS